MIAACLLVSQLLLAEPVLAQASADQMGKLSLEALTAAPPRPAYVAHRRSRSYARPRHYFGRPHYRHNRTYRFPTRGSAYPVIQHRHR